MTISERLQTAHTCEFLTVDDVALRLRLARKTVLRKIKRCEIPGVERYGRTIRIRRAVFDRGPQSTHKAGAGRDN